MLHPSVKVVQSTRHSNANLESLFSQEGIAVTVSEEEAVAEASIDHKLETRIISGSSIQYLMRGMRLGWLSWQSNCNSFLNTSKHDLGLKLKRFIATFMVRSSIHIRPLYSLPKLLNFCNVAVKQ